MRLITIISLLSATFCVRAQKLRGFQPLRYLQVPRTLPSDVWSTWPPPRKHVAKIDQLLATNTDSAPTDLWGTVSTFSPTSTDLWGVPSQSEDTAGTTEVETIIQLLKQQSTSDEVSASGCSDKYWSCPYYKRYCWHSWVKVHCPQTCNQCLGISPAMDDTLAKLQSADYSAGKLVREFHPVFDFEDDGCLPGAAISRKGEVNPGVGGIEPTTGCRSNNFMNEANTYHRWTTKVVGSSEYQVHMYDLYFEKDRTKVTKVVFIGGHRHEVETVLMYFKDGQPTHAAVSAHGNYANPTVAPCSEGIRHRHTHFPPQSRLQLRFALLSASQHTRVPFCSHQ